MNYALNPLENFLFTRELLLPLLDGRAREAGVLAGEVVFSGERP